MGLRIGEVLALSKENVDLENKVLYVKRTLTNDKEFAIILGNKTNIKVVKNKVAPPFKTATVDIMYGEGVSREGEVIDIASDLNILDKSGAWYAYKGEKIGQGKENVKATLRENKALMKEIEDQVRKHYGFKVEEEEKVKDE